MKNIFRIICLFLGSALLILACGCKADYHDAYIYFELPEKPLTVDPQTASSESELLVVRNTFEGLLRKNESGAIICGAAASYNVDGLNYTFKLRENAVWSNGTPVTANDFVFALRRAVEPATASPFVSSLFSISGAEGVYSGKLPSEQLGVTAVDDYTLNILLCREDPDFENTLTTSAAMPCNEEFFNKSVGKYGLDVENTISNGSYVLKKWNKEDFGIRLYRNEEYNGTSKALNGAVFLSCNDEETPMELLAKNSVDMAFISSAEEENAKGMGLTTKAFENTCWFLTFSADVPQNVRLAFEKLVGAEVYGKSLKNGYRAADSVFPSAFAQKGAAPSGGIVQYDLEGGKSLFSSALNKMPDRKFPSDIKLYYYDDGNVKSVVTDIVGHWQNNLGAYVNIEAVSSPDLLISQLTEQTYSMAFFPVTSKNGALEEYLKNFGIQYNGETMEDIQQRVLKGNNMTPVIFSNTTLAYSDALNSVYIFSQNGYIDFAYIIKHD